MSQYIDVKKTFIEKLSEKSRHPMLRCIAPDIRYDDDYLDVTNVQIERYRGGGSPISDYQEYSVYFESKAHTLRDIEYSDFVFDITVLINFYVSLSSVLYGSSKGYSFSFDENSFDDDDVEILDFTVFVGVRSLSMDKTFELGDGCISSFFFAKKDTGFSHPKYRYDEFLNENFKEKAVNDIKILLLKNIDLIVPCTH